MPKSINLLSLVQANEALNQDSFSSYLKHFGIEIKSQETEGLRVLTGIVRAADPSLRLLDKFYVGYKIPQIGKEFDLLRFGYKTVINIELKKSASKDVIQKQLIRNRYYLSFIGKTLYLCAFVSDSKEFYFLNSDGGLVAGSAESLVTLLREQEVNDSEHVDALFNPSDYLVSPFNSTNKFLNHEYFLTHQQEHIKDDVIKINKTTGVPRFVSIFGGAGTGKTLLTYDIAKQFIVDKTNPLIIHCGQLNAGHQNLNGNGWTIIPIKYLKNQDLTKCAAIIIDEAQRMRPEQLEGVISHINATNGVCIFSHDKSQILASSEEYRNISNKIDAIPQIVRYKLSEKIRTNKEIAAFIKMLFNSKKNLEIERTGNIEVNFFANTDDAKSYLGALDEGKWKILRFTPSQYNKEHHEEYSQSAKMTSHQAIGQEFDGVAIMIDKYFSYDGKGELIYKSGSYYHPTKMLFQNITRARKKLNIVLIDNEELLQRCLAILH